MHEIVRAKSQIVVDRRSVLHMLLEGAALCFFTRTGAERAAHALGVPADTPPPALTPAQRRLAAMGELLETSDPDAAHTLSEFVREEANRLGLDASRMEVTDRLCSVLLGEARVRDEFRTGHLQPVDGWILARSEAGACVYLHRLLRASAGMA